MSNKKKDNNKDLYWLCRFHEIQYTFLSLSRAYNMRLLGKKREKHALSESGRSWYDDITTNRFLFNSSLAVIIILSFPILFTVAVYPDTFNLSWNQGRGGFLFAIVFIAVELFGTHYKISSRKICIVISLSAITLGYFISLPFGLQDSIISAAHLYNVQLVDSWKWMWDFVVMGLYVGSSLGVLFGKKWYKIAPAGAIYLIGSAAILSLDAFFPYDSLGPLQLIVPGYLQIDQTVLTFIDNHIMNLGPGMPAIAKGNLLFLNGLHGPFALQVFWPSAGVHSMIIYTLVMLAFLFKLHIPIQRKIIYFLIGTIGTATVNLIRIISLSMFALTITTNVQEWESFHSVAGEIMFLPWLGIYIVVIMYVEGKITRRLQTVATNSKTIPTSTTLTPVDHLDNNSYDSHSAVTIDPKDSIKSDKDKL
jgi:thaumarchaeosortase